MSKTIIFDFFDVVHKDPQKAWFKKHGYSREGGFAEASDKLDNGTLDYEGYIKQFALLSGQTPDQVKADFKASAALDEGVFALLHELQGQHRLGLLSNTTPDEIHPILERHSIKPLFDEIVISAEVKMSKPDPEIFRLMLRRMNASADDAIFIDDNMHNVEAAGTVGITGICYTDIDLLRKHLRQNGVNVAAHHTHTSV